MGVDNAQHFFYAFPEPPPPFFALSPNLPPLLCISAQTEHIQRSRGADAVYQAISLYSSKDASRRELLNAPIKSFWDAVLVDKRPFLFVHRRGMGGGEVRPHLIWRDIRGGGYFLALNPFWCVATA